MKTNTVSVTYEDGNRIETVQQIYTKGDDYDTLGRLYMALGDRLTRRELAESEAEKEALAKEIDIAHALIAQQQERLSGYEGITNE